VSSEVFGEFGHAAIWDKLRSGNCSNCELRECATRCPRRWHEPGNVGSAAKVRRDLTKEERPGIFAARDGRISAGS